VTQLFDLNARIQQLTWSLIFYEQYSTSLSTIVLVVFTTANSGGFSNFCRYYTRSQTGKSTGYRPTLKPLDISGKNMYLYGYWRLTQFWVKVHQANVHLVTLQESCFKSVHCFAGNCSVASGIRSGKTLVVTGPTVRYKILGLFYKRVLFDLQFVHNLN
jgi:hypothetical protein